MDVMDAINDGDDCGDAWSESKSAWASSSKAEWRIVLSTKARYFSANLSTAFKRKDEHAFKKIRTKMYEESRHRERKKHDSMCS